MFEVYTRSCGRGLVADITGGRSASVFFDRPATPRSNRSAARRWLPNAINPYGFPPPGRCEAKDRPMRKVDFLATWMIAMKYLLLTLLTTLSLSVNASLETTTSFAGWHTRDGKPVPDADNVKSINGFGGWLLITPDVDWKEKWETPTQVTPTFSEASKVEYGHTLTILTFFVNPRKDKSGNVAIACSAKVTRPDKSVSFHQEITDCVQGPFTGDPRHVHLSPLVIRYSGDAGDQPGEWLVEVNITDNNRGTRVPLLNRFTLLEAAGGKPGSTAGR